MSHIQSPPPPPIIEHPEDADKFPLPPLPPPLIESAPHPPRDTMSSYPNDILPPLKDSFPRSSSSHTGSASAPPGPSSGTTSPGGRSPLVKSKNLGWEGMSHAHSLPEPVGGKHSPRRRNSIGGGAALTPMSQARVLLSPDAGSPSRSPQLSHGSLLHHEHSTPAVIDLPPSALGVNAVLGPTTPTMSGGGLGSHRGSLVEASHRGSLAEANSPQASALSSPTTPHLPPLTLNSLPSTFTPSTLAATLPSLSARRNSKPLLWSGNNATFKSFLSSHTVREMIAASPPQRVVEVECTCTPYEGFETLLKANILAAPVYDPAKKEYTGFLDVRDLVSSVIFAHEEQLLQAERPWSETWMDVARRKGSGGREGGENVGSASVTYLSRRSPFRPVRLSSSLLDAAKALATRVHRVPVIDESTRRCVYIISQSSIINFLIQHKALFRDEWKQSIASLSLGLCQVISISTDATAWTAFKLLEVSNVSGVAVVDGMGKLVGNTSAKDLKLFMLDRGNLSLDQLILDYLSAIRQRELTNEVHPSCSVTVSASIGHVIELMHATKYHRVFVVDKEGRPIGVLSVTDILRFACADQATVNHLQLGLARLSDEHRGSLSGTSGLAAFQASLPQATSPISPPSQPAV